MNPSSLLHRIRAALSRRAAAALLLGLLLFPSAGCFGHFPMTSASHRFNAKVSENQFLQTLTFWGMLVGLVYPYSLIADMLVLNPIEFWGGKEVKIGSGDSGSGAGTATANRDSVSTTPDGLVRLETTTDTGTPVTLLLRRVNPREFSIVDVNGNKTGILRRDDSGDVLLCSVEGDVMSRLPRAGELMRDRFK